MSAVVVVVVVAALGVLIAALLLWALRMPPTRPRPGSRYRGHTFTTVDKELRDRQR